MARLRADFVRGTITNNPLAIGDTTINSASLASLPVVSGSDICVLILDPTSAAPEIVHVTAHSSAATSATISRGQEGSSAKAHVQGTAFVHGATGDDFEIAPEGTTVLSTGATDGHVLTADGAGAAAWESPYELVEGPLVPYGLEVAGNAGTQALSVNTTAYVGLCDVTHRITVASLAFEVTAVGAAGTMAFGLFSNDGQTRHINEVTASISGTGLINTALGTPVTLNPGLYYIMLVSQSTANITVRMWGVAGSGGAAPAGDNELSGTVTVTAGTIPSTFDPDADVTYNGSGRTIFRLYS